MDKRRSSVAPHGFVGNCAKHFLSVDKMSESACGPPSSVLGPCAQQSTEEDSLNLIAG